MFLHGGACVHACGWCELMVFQPWPHGGHWFCNVGNGTSPMCACDQDLQKKLWRAPDSQSFQWPCHSRVALWWDVQIQPARESRIFRLPCVPHRSSFEPWLLFAYSSFCCLGSMFFEKALPCKATKLAPSTQYANSSSEIPHGARGNICLDSLGSLSKQVATWVSVCKNQVVANRPDGRSIDLTDTILDRHNIYNMVFCASKFG